MQVLRGACVAAFVVAGVAVSMSGCGSGDTRENTGDAPKIRAFDEDAAAILGAPIDENGTLIGVGAPAEAPEWTIVLFRVPGDDPNVGAGLVDATLRDTDLDSGPDGVRLQERGDGLFVVTGSFDSAQSPAAARTLEDVRSTSVQGVRVFGQAFLAPPPDTGVEGADPRLDLRRTKAEYGEDALYTLQVAIYGRTDNQLPSGEDLAAFRRAAEQAARTLRAEGDLAFYYHAPQRSMVTVGIFGPDDHDPSTSPPVESLSLRRMRQKHPLNLANGQGINETIRDARGQQVQRLQKSFLVAVPDSK